MAPKPVCNEFFAAEVDVTGAVNGGMRSRVGRFHRRELRYQILKCRLEILVRLRFDGHEFPLGGNTTRWECAAGTRRLSEDSHPEPRVPSKLNLQTRCGLSPLLQAVPPSGLELARFAQHMLMPLTSNSVVHQHREWTTASLWQTERRTRCQRIEVSFHLSFGKAVLASGGVIDGKSNTAFIAAMTSGSSLLGISAKVIACPTCPVPHVRLGRYAD